MLTELYVYVAQGETPQDEVVAMLAFSDGKVVPLFAPNVEDVPKLAPLAELFQESTGKTLKLVRFSSREDVTL